MQFQIECFENVEAFSRHSPVVWTDAEQFRPYLGALRRVENLRVEADTAQGACDEAFHIGNAPWNPVDLDGRMWNMGVRSMSTGDVVVVHTPDGPAAYGCLSMGWALLPPDMLPAGVEA